MASAIPAAKGPRFEVERRARQIPVGSLVDVRRGSVILSSGRTANGNEINSGVFGGGRFQVLQSRKRRLAGLTTLRLQGGDYAKCATRARSSGAVLPVQSARLRQRTIRRIRGRAHGRFRTRGRHSAATVRGTTFSVADRCDGTLTKVRSGTVKVRDFGLHKTVIVRAGHSYLARTSTSP